MRYGIDPGPISLIADKGESIMNQLEYDGRDWKTIDDARGKVKNKGE